MRHCRNISATVSKPSAEPAISPARPLIQIVIPGRPGASKMRHPTGARTRAPRGAASPESFQRPVFMDSGPRPSGDPGMTDVTAAALGPGDRAARVWHGRGFLLPVLRPRRHRPRHLDAVDKDRIDLLVEE